MQSQNNSKKIKRARIIFVCLSIITTLLIINYILHPRGRYIYITLPFLLCWIISLCNIRAKKGPSFPNFLYPFLIGIILFFGYLTPTVFFFEYFLTSYWPWEYKNEIAPYREMYYTASYFPETLPECATDVKFVIKPSYWQGKGYVTLSFIADDAYIQECINGHIQQFLEFNEFQEVEDVMIDGSFPNLSVDLYSFFMKQYNDESYQEFCNAFSISKEEAAEQLLDLPQGVELTMEELETATQYHIDWNKGQHGFIIMKATNRIIFYLDYERM